MRTRSCVSYSFIEMFILKRFQLGPLFSSKSLVTYLDQFIVGQSEAKKSLAIAMVDRNRRMQISDPEMRKAIVPSNILLLGPTGCGKTEVARRLAKHVDAPFVKVVATKYSEVGFVGEDTSSMIEELAEQAFADEVRKMNLQVETEAMRIAVDEVAQIVWLKRQATDDPVTVDEVKAMVASGLVDSEEIEIPGTDVAEKEEMVFTGKTILSPRTIRMSKSRPSRLSTVGQALRTVTERASAVLSRTREPDLKERARKSVEERGIVFIDEFDKMISDASEEGSSFNQKRKGVEKELLTLVEGTSITTKKLGPINTDHIVFICAGAFSSVSPKQIMPELQGRLPIRCTMKGLTEDDLVSILNTIEFSLPRTQKELLAVDGIHLEFTPCGIREVAKCAVYMNKELVNTGARRLTTVMGIVLEEIKFAADELMGETVLIDSQFVRERLDIDTLGKPEDLRKYVL